ncbi:hypothetical protein FRC10_001502 [Ceratobasidium sp. 414]|nr:hypothetical protein FRC10_001502 [Ceratobasidium sp. 414]
MAAPLLISELAYPTHRAPLTALYHCLWFSGSIVAVISVGREQEALKVLKKWHAGGEENNGLVHFEYHEVKRAIASEADQGESSLVPLAAAFISRNFSGDAEWTLPRLLGMARPVPYTRKPPAHADCYCHRSVLAAEWEWVDRLLS